MDNRTRLRELLEKHDLKQHEGAALICAYTHRPCAVRTVRAWLADPSKPSAYDCPDWAISALEGAVLEREVERAKAAKKKAG